MYVYIILLVGEACPGNHYLLRFQDRLVWTVILERGSAYCTINIKGLELQETSCHTAEAARIDDIFESAFEPAERSCYVGELNKYPLHALTPADACNLEAYSDARNVLTGIIDVPSATEETMKAFLKSLVWILLNHVRKKNKAKESKSVKGEKISRELSFVTSVEKHEMKELNKNGNINAHIPEKSKKLENTSLPPLVPEFSRKVRSPSPPPVYNSKQKKMASSWGSLDSFTDSIFSDDGEHVKKKPAKPPGPLKPLPPVRNKSPDIEDMLDDFDMGIPAFDVTKPKPQTQNKFSTKGFGNTIYKPQTNLAGSPDFKSPYSRQLSLPVDWRELPLDHSQVSRLLSKFPADWYKHVLSCLELSHQNESSDKVLKDVIGDDALRNTYAQLVMACYSIFDSQGNISLLFRYLYT